IYRITFDGSVNDEHGYVAMGGQAEGIATVLKEHYTDDMTLSGALAAAIAGMAAQANGDRMDITATQLEVAVLDRSRDHRTFRRITGTRLESLLAEVGQSGSGQATAKREGGKQAGAAPAAEDASSADAQEPGSDDSAGSSESDSGGGSPA